MFEVLFSWGASAPVAGATILNYEVSYRVNGVQQTNIIVNPSQLSVTLTGLSFNQTVIAQVIARVADSATGRDSDWNAEAQITMPDKPKLTTPGTGSFGTPTAV